MYGKSVQLQKARLHTLTWPTAKQKDKSARCLTEWMTFTSIKIFKWKCCVFCLYHAPSNNMQWSVLLLVCNFLMSLESCGRGDSLWEKYLYPPHTHTYVHMHKQTPAHTYSALPSILEMKNVGPYIRQRVHCLWGTGLQVNGVPCRERKEWVFCRLCCNHTHCSSQPSVPYEYGVIEWREHLLDLVSSLPFDHRFQSVCLSLKVMLVVDTDMLEWLS